MNLEKTAPFSSTLNTLKLGADGVNFKGTLIIKQALAQDWELLQSDVETSKQLIN